MRVVFGPQRFAVQPFGGVSRYIFDLARALSRIEGVDASIFAPLHVNRYLDDSTIVKPWGIRLPYFSGSGVPLGLANFALSKWLLRRGPSVDIYHESYYTRLDSCPPGAARVITAYDMIHEIFPDSFGAMDRTSRVKRTAIARADHVICISESTRRDLVRIFDIPIHKTSVVYLGNSLVPAGAPQPARVEGRPYLLYVGARSGYKNFEGLLRAYASSRSLRRELRVLCFGGGPLRKSEMELCISLGLSTDDVRQAGGSDRDLASAYQGAAMLVYPSLYEGFGLPPLEAMSLGCPVVCADSSSIPEVVGEAGRYFDPASIDSIRLAIEEVARSTSLRNELAVSGRQRASLFSWDRCAAETLDVYRIVHGRGGSATPVH